MQARQLDIPAFSKRTPDLVFRSAPNWICVVFFACLGLLHMGIATLALVHGRFEAYLSVALGVIFGVVAILAYRWRFEMTIISHDRSIRLRTGLQRINHVRHISFDDVNGIRLTLSHRDESGSRIELLCKCENIECPPTTIPREEALCLAMLMRVRLIKVSDWEEHDSRLNVLDDLNESMN